MKVDIEKLSSVERKLSFEVPWDKVKAELDLAYRDLAKRAKVKGFRAGKVPRKVLEQFYKQAVEGQVVNALVDNSFQEAVKEHDIVPIANPKMDAMPEVEDKKPLSFEAVVQVKPEVDVTGYEALEVEKKVRKIDDSEVDAELEALRDKATIIEPITDRKDAQQGDLAVVDFFGYINGETFKGGKGISYTVEIGSGRMIEGFEEQVVGMNVTDEKTFELTFPKDQGPDEVRGKKVEWKVELKELKRKVLPELDDEFAKDLGDYDTLAELKENLRTNLATREDASSKRMLRDAVMEKLVEMHEVDIPDVMVERQLDFLLQDATRMAEQQDNPEIREAIAKLRVEARPRAERQVAGMLLLEGVARKENIEVEDAALEGRIQDLSREHRIPVNQLKIQLKQNDQIDALKYNLRQDQTLDWLLERAKITEREVTKEELEAEEAAAAEG